MEFKRDLSLKKSASRRKGKCTINMFYNVKYTRAEKSFHTKNEFTNSTYQRLIRINLLKHNCTINTYKII